MQMYTLPPFVPSTLTDSALETIATAGALNARLQVVKLVILNLGNILFQAFAATTKLAFTAVQLPLYPIFGGTSPRMSIIEAGTHTVHIVKLVAATTLVTIPALIFPTLAPKSYNWLGLTRQIPALIPLTGMQRIHKALKQAVASPYFKPALAATALLTTCAVFGFVYNTSDNTTPQPDHNQQSPNKKDAQPPNKADTTVISDGSKTPVMNEPVVTGGWIQPLVLFSLTVLGLPICAIRSIAALPMPERKASPLMFASIKTARKFFPIETPKAFLKECQRLLVQDIKELPKTIHNLGLVLILGIAYTGWRALTTKI